MKPVRTFFLAGILAVLTLPAFAQTQGADTTGYDQPQAGRHHRHDRTGRMTREQKIVWRMEMKEQMRSLPRDERKAFRQKMKAQWKTMDAAQRQQHVAELDSRWNALPADERNAMLRKAANRHKDKGGRAKKHGGKHKHGDADDDATE